MKKRNYQLILIATIFSISGCVGNRAEMNAVKIERKPSAAEEAQGWAAAIKTIWRGDDGSD